MILLTMAFKDAVLIISILPIAVHIFINVVWFIVHFNKNRSLSLTYLLSALLVLLVGFPSCWGLAAIRGGGFVFP
jgi:hypothetical protein